MNLNQLISNNNFTGNLQSHITGPAVSVYLLFIYTFPFNAGTHYNLLFFTIFLVAFIGYVFITTRKHPFSLIQQLKAHHPLVFYVLISLLATSIISLSSILISEVSQKHKAAALLRYMMYILIVLYTFALARFCIIRKLSHTKIFFCFILGILTLTILQLIAYQLNQNIDANTWFLHPPFGHHIRDTGNLAAISSVICIIFLLFLKQSRPFLLSIICTCTIASWAFLIWSGGRTGITSAIIVSMVVVIMAIIYLERDFRRLTVVLLCISISFPLANSLSVFPWNGFKRTSETLSTALTTNKNAINASEGKSFLQTSSKFTTGRVATWKLSLIAVKKSPWFGLGPNGFYFIPERFYGDHPHNFIIQFLVEWGITGASLLLILLLYFAWYGIRQLPLAFREKDTSYIISAAIVLTLTLHGLTGGTYFMLQPLFCLVTAFAVFPFGRISRVQEKQV